MNIQETPAQRAKRKREERIMELYESLRPKFKTEYQTYNAIAERLLVSVSKVQQLVLSRKKEEAAI